eukprot:CAMPEP_0198252638 /NCGR_PEP_ID=MMETSP1447-20131203/3124_1 /TAXON_ID=420782 /ORGANISM="Chaetoceros dichaeta, Strain CCMP1751" /LENGTH=479 /DNA_ID=CAMNT_0043937971 /DNA_START=148 /DNA_END=1587 /DNA_ORIENTATION=-
MTSSIRKKVVIVGGGPAGAAAAKAMADRGYQVDLFEAYPNPSLLSNTSSKAYVIALSPRGQKGIQDATGIDPVTNVPGAIVSTSLARHGKKKAKIMNHDALPSLIVTRKALTQYLLDAAKASGVSIHFQQRLEEIDFEKRCATFVASSSDCDPDSTTTSNRTGKKTTQVVEYDLLIGADGSNSKVRNLMASNLKEFTARTEEDSMEYQVVVLPKSPHPSEVDFPGGTVHTWNNKGMNAICLGFPVSHGTLLLIVFPKGELASFRTSGYRSALEALLPDVVESSYPEIEKQLRENQIASGGLCVWSSHLGLDGVILLGDSGHGMWPSLGQGANCALESVAVFTQCLDDLPADSASWINELLQRFQDARSIDATAAVDLTYGGIGARKSRGRQNAPLSFKLQIVGIMLLNKLSFGIVPKPALLQLMSGSMIPYSKALKYTFYYEKYLCLMITAAVIIPLLWSQLKLSTGSNINSPGGHDGL